MEGPASPMDTSTDDPRTPTMDEYGDGPQTPKDSADDSMQEGPQSPAGPASPDMYNRPSSPPQPKTPDSVAEEALEETNRSPAAVPSASPPQSPSKQNTEQDTQDKASSNGMVNDAGDSKPASNNKESESSTVRISSSNDLTKVHDDHGELDFDEELDEIDEKDKSGGDRGLDKGKEEGEAAKDGVTAADDDGHLSVSAAAAASWIPSRTTAGFICNKKWTWWIKVVKSGLSGIKSIKFNPKSIKCKPESKKCSIK